MTRFALPRSAAALLLAIFLSAPFSASAQDKRTADDPAAWVSQRIQLWQPAAEERRFDDIGWVRDILEARRLARQHQRPIFLFSHDGHMAIGRC